MKPLGDIIRRIRREKSFTQSEVAKKAGVSTSFISHIENNSRTPDVELVSRIAAALEVSASAIIEEYDHPGASSRAHPMSETLKRDHVKYLGRVYLPEPGGEMFLEEPVVQGASIPFFTTPDPGIHSELNS